MVTRGTGSSEGGEDAFLSAVQRLHNPVLTFDGRHLLKAMNYAAVRLMHEESIPEDLYDRQRSHPLSRLLGEMISASAGQEPAFDPTVTFPSGHVFDVEISERSGKGANRLLLLIFRDRARRLRAKEGELFRQWDLTARECDVARMLLEGASSDEICEKMKISRNTLKSHLGHLFEKSGTRTRSELLLKIRS